MWSGAALSAVLIATGLLFASAAAQAAFPPQFWDRCDADEPAGQRCSTVPRGVAANPANGRIYLADELRIVEFSAWGEFRRTWGWDVVASGPNDTAEDEFEVCVPAEGDTCKAGSSGGGAGQFKLALGLAIDSAGDLYAFDRGVLSDPNLRVQKFAVSDAGVAFAWMVGRSVNQGPNNPGNLCTAAHIASGDTCGAGAQGSGTGEFGATNPFGSYIAVGPNDEVWVGDEGRIQRFDTSGVYQDEIAFAGTIAGLAVDPTSGDLYAHTTGADVQKLSPAGADLGTIAVARPIALATDLDGNLYVADNSFSENGGLSTGALTIRSFSAAGAELESFEQGDSGNSGHSARGIAVNPVTAAGDLALYVSTTAGSSPFLRAYSPVPDPDLVGPPASVPPTIADPFAAEVGIEEARLVAEINPHFWDDATYYLEYGSQGPCDSNPCQQVGFPGISLDSGIVDAAIRVEFDLEGLAPGTTFHYRFLASSGGGQSLSEDLSFTTFPEAELRTDCPNQAFRTGPGARLTDCRAYELVSPADKNGGDVDALGQDQFLFGPDGEATHYRSSPDGTRLGYGAFDAFADAVAAPWTSNYIATRAPGAGWSSHAIDPPRGEHLFNSGLPRTYNSLIYLSEDLSFGFYRHDAKPLLHPAAVEGYANLYRRQNAGDTYTPLTTVTPPTTPAATPSGDIGYKPALHGFSADGTHAVFTANDRLTANASSATYSAPDAGKPIRQLYEHRDGAPLRLASVLPNGSASPEPSFAGGGTLLNQNAVSADGSVIYFTTSFNWGPGSDWLSPQMTEAYSGTIYARLNGATTVPVATNGQFWAAAADGSAALYTSGDTLFRFDLASETSTEIATGIVIRTVASVGKAGGVIGSSEDLSRAYIVSTEVLDPGPNPAGDTAEAGAHNIFFYQEGEGFSFVAPQIDVGAGETPEQRQTGNHNLSLTPDGRHLAFVSRLPLTGYDSTDQDTGVRLTEAFLYSAESEELRCLSCDPSGARSLGGEIVSPVTGPGTGRGFDNVGGWIAGWRNGQQPFGRQRVVSDDGDRVFFDSYHDILPEDANGSLDVYEWRAPGTGDCSTESAYYFEANGGCLGLISSGGAEGDSDFVEASADGQAVFFRSDERLTPHDFDGELDIYAARLGGGFAAPAPAPAPCEGEGCRGAGPAAPAAVGAGSAAFIGPGNQGSRPDCSRLSRAAKRLRGQARGLRTRARRLAAAARRSSSPKRSKAMRGQAKRLAATAKKRSRAARKQAGRAKRCRRAAR